MQYPKIVEALPPNIAAIRKVFDVDGKAILYAYNDTIYNPTGTSIPPELYAHEREHLRRQDGKAEIWWELYLSDVKFRFHEELVAHQAEYDYVRSNYNRARRRAMLSAISERLASSLYGSLTTKTRAKELILNGLT